MILRWFRLHLQSLAGAFGRLGSTLVGALLNILVVAIALALPAAMQVLLTNAGSIAPAPADLAVDIGNGAVIAVCPARASSL